MCQVDTMSMPERRAIQRNRTYLEGHVAFNGRCSTVTCLVRNMSQNGAKIVFAATALIPNEFDLLIPNKAESRRARIIWRDDLQVGISFLESEKAAVVSIESARKIKKLEAERGALAARVAQLSEPAC
jgi:hypothetical protein